MPYLEILAISDNQLTGTFPASISNASNLIQLEIVLNKFTGNFPSFNKMEKLQWFDIAGNHLGGGGEDDLNFLCTLTNATGLQVLAMSSNNFGGVIPEYISNLSRNLAMLYIGYNEIQGRIPAGIGNLINLEALYVYNNRLSGHIPPIIGMLQRLQWLDVGKNSLFESIPHSFGNLKMLTKMSLSYNNLQGSIPPSLSKCKNLITLDLSNNNLSGIVPPELAGLSSFVDYQGNDFKALVYEFMVHGSLEDWLHPSVGMNEAEEAPKKLEFSQRLNMVIEVAYALEYLHHRCETSIVHCDLKPRNILFDDEMVAHVGYFGLAGFMSAGMQNYSTSLPSSLRGTIGYVAPEYGLGNKVSTYSDVYIYGIFLLEMFTGKRPTDEMFKEDLNLYIYVKLALPESVAEITDPILLQEIVRGETVPNNTTI
ncbi:hypothetical protein REPUB_Repub13aG0098000 [Reevesia pubescens]